MIVAYREQIGAPLVNFNITATIAQLESVDSQLVALGMPTVVASLRADIASIMTNLMDLQNSQIPNIMIQVVSSSSTLLQCISIPLVLISAVLCLARG